MIWSMTGFGRGSESSAGRVVTAEIKALNSKQLDLVVRVPNRYRCLEGWLRNTIAEKASRGKIEVVISTELTGLDLPSSINIDLVARYKAEIEKMDAALGIPNPDDWHSVLLRLPDVLKGEDNEIADDEMQAFRGAVLAACDDMAVFRKDEGEKLNSFFREKIDSIRSLLLQVDPFEESRVKKIKNRLYEQLAKLSGVDVDNGRLEQELIYYIEKLDVSEEKQRLRAHLDYFIKTMDDDSETSKGKKLGFIAQEMGREINTLGSKSNNAEMQILVVKMKDELEQIKEQVLNVL